MVTVNLGYLEKRGVASSLIEKLEMYRKYISDSRFREDYKALKYAANGYVHYCIEKLDELEVIDALEGGATVNEICERKGIEHKDMLELMLNILVGRDMLIYSNGEYQIKEIENPFSEEQYKWLDENYPASTEFTMFLLEHSEEVLKTGEPIEEAGFQGEFMEVWDNMMEEFPYSFKMMMLQKMDIGNGDKILDLGCGSGSLLEMILQDADEPVYLTGIDMSQDSLEIARERLQKIKRNTNSDIMRANIDRIELKQCNLIKNFPQNDTFDHVISSLVFHHISKEERETIIENISCILHPGGKLGIYEFMHPSEYEPLPFWLMHCVPTHNQYPFRDEFLSIVGENFDSVKTYAEDTVIIARK